MKIVLKGQVPSQKNNKQIYRNKSTGRVFIASNDKVKLWQNYVDIQLLSLRIKEPFENKVVAHYKFYVQDNRRRDIDNMIASVNDSLMRAQIIRDDSWQWLKLGSADAEIDKENPRVEIILEEI